MLKFKGNNLISGIVQFRETTNVQNCSQLPLLRVWVDGAEVKSPQGSPLSTGVRAGAPPPPEPLSELSKPPRRSMAWLEGDTGVITELGAGLGVGRGAAPGGGGSKSGPPPEVAPLGFSFFVGRSRLRLTLERR